MNQPKQTKQPKQPTKDLTLEKNLQRIITQLDNIDKQIVRMKSRAIIEQKLQHAEHQNEYLITNILHLLQEYSRNKSTGAQKLCSKIRRILYELDEKVDHNERCRVG